MDSTRTDDDKYRFWIDRGGTFTDVVSKRGGEPHVVRKLLSSNPELYQDAAVQGIRDILGLTDGEPIPGEALESVKMGTTVGTNALLERRGEPTCLAITEGFGDGLRIGYQNRPDLFKLDVRPHPPLYSEIVEVVERVSNDGAILKALDRDRACTDLERVYKSGIRSLAIALVHGHRFPGNERELAGIGREIGFDWIAVSHLTSPLVKLIGRAQTTVADGYLSPLLARYVDSVSSRLETAGEPANLFFMQSNGGLTSASDFRGKDSVLSGPAGGIVGAAKTARSAGYDRIITFDMGGTSTDVAHYAGDYERELETEIGGVRLRTPMLNIHTVAAGGGSICSFDGSRFRAGPESAGAVPGPASYQRGGPLTVTDCNVVLGRIDPLYFPKVFGPSGDGFLDPDPAIKLFREMAAEVSEATGNRLSWEALAEGFLNVAVETMAAAIKKISVEKGHGLKDHSLSCFGGAGGQHACLVADSLGMETILIHPLAGVLSALGIGLADRTMMVERSVNWDLSCTELGEFETLFREMERAETARLDDADTATIARRVHLRYEGSDSSLEVAYDQPAAMRKEFEQLHLSRYGFAEPELAVVAETLIAELTVATTESAEVVAPVVSAAPAMPKTTTRRWFEGWVDAPLYLRDELPAGTMIDGPAIISESTGTNVVEPGWRARMLKDGHLLLTRVEPLRCDTLPTKVDPSLLEIFNKRFTSVAEHMGVTLKNTSHSVNIKERLDFSCALFDREGKLIANAPHIPVHLGSMGDAVASVLKERGGVFTPGEAFLLNSPYAGGTHLPDVTVVTPVFAPDSGSLEGYVASRGHHGDVGGVTPGSIPPFSKTLEEEGVSTSCMRIVSKGRFLKERVDRWLSSSPYPARNPERNVADIKAQLAANTVGAAELAKLWRHYSLDVVRAYMGHVVDNGRTAVERLLATMEGGSHTLTTDNDATISVRVDVDNDARQAVIDFSGTSPQREDNFNAPASVVKAAALYVFRSLVADDIPLNSGCLLPLELRIPEGSMLSPVHPGAVVAGNVETSQLIVDCLLAALGAQAASQGTMNNLTFGNATHQYYETLAGGVGGGPGFDGASGVHSHMTNSLITDPEILEERYPVVVERFSLRPNTGGGGTHPGGDGIVRRIRFLEPMTATILSGRRRTVPFGLMGGEDGEPGLNRVIRRDGSVEELAGADRSEMEAGDAIEINTPGGGGYGKRS